MKTIGLLGGMSWESTQIYYRLINTGIKQRLGKLHSARLVLYSVDFEEIETLQRQGHWKQAGALLADAAQAVSAAGADFLLICTNTMHIVFDQIQAAVEIPLLHIADATADRVKDLGQSKVGLLGTNFTMTEAFYKGRLAEHHGIEVLTPNQSDRGLVHRVIYEELCLGHIRDTSRDAFARIAAELANQGAESVLLGCTEIGLLLKQEHTEVPLLDTTVIHAQAAVTYALDS